MTRFVRILTIFIAMVALSVPSSGQDRNQWRTATDIREGVSGSIVGTVVDVDDARKQIILAADDDRNVRVTILTDSVSTQYLGFGGMINGSPEVFTGSSGFSNVRAGDRLDVRGTGRSNYAVMADRISLLGRSVPAPQTGVGTSRLPGSVNTPTTTATGTADTVGRIEGTVRQVNANDFRVVIETDRREMVNVRGNSGTPVYYRGEVYHLNNLEVGDRIRVEADPGSTSAGEIRARVIDVIRSVQEGSTGSRVTSVAGRISRVDRAADVVRVDTGRGEARVDVSRANDSSGRRVRASDLQVGDRVDISGNYSGNSDLFIATTVRFADDVFQPRPDQQPEDRYVTDYALVTMTATVTESLENSPRLVVRDRATDRTLEIFVADDFVVRTKSGSYTTADRLRIGDDVLIKAYRDRDGNHLAQSIRIRTEASR